MLSKPDSGDWVGGVCEGISHKYIWQGQRAPCLGAELPQIQNRLSSRLASDTQKTFGVPLFQLLTVNNLAQWQTAFLKVFFHCQGPRCRHSTQGQGPQARLGPVASALGTGVTHIAWESDWRLEEEEKGETSRDGLHVTWRPSCWSGAVWGVKVNRRRWTALPLTPPLTLRSPPPLELPGGCTLNPATQTKPV